jgi:hypothetical protein
VLARRWIRVHDERPEKVGAVTQHIRRQDADDGAGSAVDAQGASEHTRVGAKSTLPVHVRQDHDVVPRSLKLLRQEPTAEGRMHTKSRQPLRRNHRSIRLVCGVAFVDLETHPIIGGDALEERRQISDAREIDERHVVRRLR